MKKVVFVVAYKNFRDEELFDTLEIIKQNGISYDIASIEKGTATGMFGGIVNVTKTLNEVNVNDYDAIILIGGSGVPSIRSSAKLINIIQEFYSKKKLICAICWSPTILAKANILKDKKATVWLGYDPEYKMNTNEVLKKYGAKFENLPVVVDENIVTANGPTAAKEFGNTIVSLLIS